MRILGAGLLALCAAANASAADSWYVGADAGIASNVTQEGNNGRVYAGYQLGTAQMLGMQQVNALEVQAYQYNFRKIYTQGASYTWVQHVRAKGGAVAWASALKVNETVALNSRLGVSYTEARTRDGFGMNSKVGPLASVGASYALNDNVKLRADLNYMQIQTGYKADMDHAVLSTGLALQF